MNFVDHRKLLAAVWGAQPTTWSAASAQLVHGKSLHWTSKSFWIICSSISALHSGFLCSEAHGTDRSDSVITDLWKTPEKLEEAEDIQGLRIFTSLILFLSLCFSHCSFSCRLFNRFPLLKSPDTFHVLNKNHLLLRRTKLKSQTLLTTLHNLMRYCSTCWCSEQVSRKTLNYYHTKL